MYCFGDTKRPKASELQQELAVSANPPLNVCPRRGHCAGLWPGARWLADKTSLSKPKIPRVRLATKVNRLLPLVEASLLSDPFKTCLQVAKNLGASKELVRTCFHRLGFSCKKARYYGVSKNGVALAKEFLRRRTQYIQESRPIYSVDETGFGRFSYHYRKGWAPVGKQLRVKKTCARQTSTSVIACASETRWEQIREVKGGVNKIMSFASSSGVWISQRDP